MSRILRILGFGVGLETFANFWRVSLSVSENLVSVKKSRFWFRKKSIGFGEFGIGKKVSVLVSENLVSEKSLGFGFGKFGLGKKVSVSVLVKILVSSFSGFDSALAHLYVHFSVLDIDDLFGQKL